MEQAVKILAVSRCRRRSSLGNSTATEPKTDETCSDAATAHGAGWVTPESVGNGLGEEACGGVAKEGAGLVCGQGAGLVPAGEGAGPVFTPWVSFGITGAKGEGRVWDVCGTISPRRTGPPGRTYCKLGKNAGRGLAV